MWALRAVRLMRGTTGHVGGCRILRSVLTRGLRMGRWAVAGCAVLATVALAGCVDAREGSALVLDAGAERICVPAPADIGEGTIFGGTWLESRGDGELTFTGLDLLDPDGLTLTEALLVPDPWPDGDLVGMRHESTTDPFPEQWDDRVALAGAVLQPGETRNLVIVVTADGSDVATVTGLRVGYADADERRYHQDLPVTLVVANIPCSEALDFAT